MRGMAHLCVCLLIALLPGKAGAAPQDTDIAGVTADMAFLRQYDGVLHAGIVLNNSNTKEVAAPKPLELGEVVIIDKKANKKYFPLKDANGRFLGGPADSTLAGGRWDVRLAPKSESLLWVLFDAVTPGASVSVEGPVFHSFDNVPVSDGPPPSGQDLVSSLPPMRASLISANRADGQLKVRLKVIRLPPSA